MATSGLGTSINSSWDHDNLVESVVNYRTQPFDKGVSGFYETSFSGGNVGNYSGGNLGNSLGKTIDLYRERDGIGSDSELEGDEFDA